MRTLTTLLASVVLTLGAASAMAQEISAPAAPAKTRAEVRADLDMFHRAGLSHVSPAGYEDAAEGGQYRKAYAEYQRLLASPAYTAAVAKYESASASRMAAK